VSPVAMRIPSGSDDHTPTVNIINAVATPRRYPHRHGGHYTTTLLPPLLPSATQIEHSCSERRQYLLRHTHTLSLHHNHPPPHSTGYRSVFVTTSARWGLCTGVQVSGAGGRERRSRGGVRSPSPTRCTMTIETSSLRLAPATTTTTTLAQDSHQELKSKGTPREGSRNSAPLEECSHCSLYTNGSLQILRTL
jgi:hypothetical protein